MDSFFTVFFFVVAIGGSIYYIRTAIGFYQLKRWAYSATKNAPVFYWGWGLDLPEIRKAFQIAESDSKKQIIIGLAISGLGAFIFASLTRLIQLGRSRK